LSSALRAVILPFDILYLIAVGSLLGFASTVLASKVDTVSGVRSMMWWLFPIAYMLFDLVEDLFIVSILTRSTLLSEGSFRVLTGLTTTKIWAIWASIGQTALLLAGWLLTLDATHLR
jgi:hypothetical protein